MRTSFCPSAKKTSWPRLDHWQQSPKIAAKATPTNSRLRNLASRARPLPTKAVSLQASRMDEVESKPSLANSLRDRCRRELVRALKLLGEPARDRDEGVHEGRKCVRRVRAWLRLLAPSMRKDLADVDAKLRAIRRTLGPLRDAHSRCEALAAMRKRRDLGDLRPHLVEARELFTARLEQRWSRRPRDGRAWRRMLAELSILVDSIAHWPIDDLRPKFLHRGLRRAWQNARKLKRQCSGRTAAPLRHRWRGRVRILVLQCQLLEQLALIQAPSDLKSLGQALGEEHDMAVVSSELGLLKLGASAEQGLRNYLRKRRLGLARANDKLAKRVLGPNARPQFL